MTGSPEEKPFTKPIHVDDVPWEPWSEGTRFGSRAKQIGRAAGAMHVGVLIEELPPGKQSSPAHYHMREEEHMWFLEGSATLRLGDKAYEVSAGDFVSFPAGQKAAHCLINNGTAPCKFVVIGERHPDDVCVYPDSQKVMVRATGDVYDLKTLDYWEREKIND